MRNRTCNRWHLCNCCMHDMQNTYQIAALGVATRDRLHEENTAFADSCFLNFLGNGGNGILQKPCKTKNEKESTWQATCHHLCNR